MTAASLGLAQESGKRLNRLEEQAFKEAMAVVAPSVVRIETVGGLDHVGRLLTGTGPTTGVVVSPDGFIVTSSFNFISKPASILVTLDDGRRFAAERVATDKLKMLTLIKISATNLTPMPAAAPHDVRVGQWAIALGRSYSGSTPSISVGIVSALGRIWGKAIQTDAKVSPVNYGGPLVDVQGRALGVLVPLSVQGSGEVSGTEWYDSGIGFAIPMADVLAAVGRLRMGKDLLPGLIGITLKGRDLYGSRPVIDRVRYDSPAQHSGLKTGDQIVEIEGQQVVRLAQVRHALGNKYAGDKIQITAGSGDRMIRRELTLVERLPAYESAFLGILPSRESAATTSTAKGVGIRHVYPDSPADKAGLEIGQRILRIDDTDVADAAQLSDFVSRVRPEQKVRLVIEANGRTDRLEVQLAAIPDAVPTSLGPVRISKPAANGDQDAPQTGRFTESMPAHEHDFWAYVPEDFNADHQYALMVWIHPEGNTMEAALLKAWKFVCDERGIILLAPKAKDVKAWNVDEAGFVKDAVELFIQRYSIDRRRILLHSFSSGGQFAFHLAFKQRELFRAVAVAASLLNVRPPENVPDFKLQFYLACGQKDRLYRGVSMIAKGLRALKYPVTFHSLPEFGHQYPPQQLIEEIGRWIDSLDRI